MTKRTDGALALADYGPDDDDLATSQLQAEAAADHDTEGKTGSLREPIDWVARLRTATQNLTTNLEDPLSTTELHSAGMSRHSTAPRISLTRKAKLAGNARRGALLLCLSVLGVALLAGGVYALLGTSWLSTLLTPIAPPQAPHTTPAGQPGGGAGAPADTFTEGPQTGASAAQLSDRAFEQYRRGNYSDAINLLETSVSLWDNDSMAYYRLGMAFMAAAGREHSLEDAEMAFRTAASLQPDWPPPHQMLAESLLRQDRYQDAIPPALKATELNGSQPQVWMTLSRAYAGAGRTADATAASAQAARLAPAPPEP